MSNGRCLDYVPYINNAVDETLELKSLEDSNLHNLALLTHYLTISYGLPEATSPGYPTNLAGYQPTLVYKHSEQTNTTKLYSISCASASGSNHFQNQLFLSLEVKVSNKL